MAKKRIHLDPDKLRRLYHGHRLGIDAVAKRLNTSHGSVWRAMDSYRIPRRDPSEAHRQHERKNFSGNQIEKAYLIGIRIGDLWVRKNKPGPASETVLVSCHTTRPEQTALIKSLFEPYGHFHITKSASTEQIIFYLNLSFEFLLEKPKEIPSWILEERETFLGFLAGYIDAEGSFGVSQPGRAVFQLKSYDQRILEQIAVALFRLAKISCHAPTLAQSKFSPTGHGYYLKKDAWKIAITKKETLEQFCLLLEPYLRHSKRRLNLRQVQSALKSAN